MLRIFAMTSLVLIIGISQIWAQDSLQTIPVKADQTEATIDDTVQAEADSTALPRKDNENLISGLALPILVTSLLGGVLYLLFSRRGS